MNKLHFLTLLALLTLGCAAPVTSTESSQDTSMAIEKTSSFHPIVQRAKETSLYANRVNWEMLNKEFLDLSQGTSNADELKPALEHLINALGDKHATFRKSSDYSLVASFTGELDREDMRDANFVNEVINDINLSFSYELLKDHVGYLKVVGIHPAADVKEQADLIRNGIDALAKQGVEEWILDLRFNGGGNMNPMLSGLAPLLGDGNIGGSMDAEGEVFQSLSIQNNQLKDGDRLVCEMAGGLEALRNHKVAVLLSRYTVSSGELVAIAFKGRPKTIFIGENTGGYVTGNGFDHVSDDLLMVISQSVFVDRNGTVYDEYVPVDIENNFDITRKTDLQMTSAKAWLKD